MGSARVAAAARSFDADLVALSAARINELKAVRQAVEVLRRRSVKVLVGGAAFAEVPELWRRLGADGHAGAADEAVAAGARLLGLS
ncbi:MAG: cobalamin B12-binding domain-containing protein [bacterium]|nr:cobalamin B12-binding domain-containing protein [bacterium]